MEKLSLPRVLYLAVYLSPSGIKVNDFISLSIKEPLKSFRFIENAMEEGIVTISEGDGESLLIWTGSADNSVSILEKAEDSDWINLARHSRFRNEMLSVAENSIEKLNEFLAARIHMALLKEVEPEEFQGGPLAWVDLLLKSFRLNIVLHWLDIDLLDRAIDISISMGKLDRQAPLLAARGFREIYGGNSEKAMEYYLHAKEAAHAMRNPSLEMEVNLYISLSLQIVGRLQTSVEWFEEWLGNSDENLFLPGMQTTMDSTFHTFGVLAVAYVNTGSAPRGIELAHRLRNFGEKSNSDHLTTIAHIALARIYSELGEVQSAENWSNSAYRFASNQKESFMPVWYAAVPLAWCKMKKGDRLEAASILRRAVENRENESWPYFYGSVLLELIEGLADLLPESLIRERESSLESPNIFIRGVATLHMAQRIRRSINMPEMNSELEGLFERSTMLLEQAGGRYRLKKFHSSRNQQKSERSEPHQKTPQTFPFLFSNRMDRNRYLMNSVIELGNISSLSMKREGIFGHFLAGVMRLFGVERAKLAERHPHKKILASRGESVPTGDQSINRTEVRFPYGSKRGVLLLENTYTEPTLSQADKEIVANLSKQLTIFMENISCLKQMRSSDDLQLIENIYHPQKGESAIVGDSLPVRDLQSMIDKVAPTDSTVLIYGDTGVGKELVAHEIFKRSERKNRPFLTLHLSSIAPGLVASSLFGHEKGAFTGATTRMKGRFELSDGGTLFLDEVGELRLEDQVMLLRVLQDGCFERLGGHRPIHSDFRLITATNRDLKKEVEAGRFREDLYYRLNVFSLNVPSLRERPEDIPLLALHFISQASRKLGKEFRNIPESALENLKSYSWPGNVRELQHFMEKAVLLSDTSTLQIPTLTDTPQSIDRRSMDVTPGSLEDAMRNYFESLLIFTGGKVTGEGGAADISGLKPSTFNWKIKKLGLRAALEEIRKSIKKS